MLKRTENMAISINIISILILLSGVCKSVDKENKDLQHVGIPPQPIIIHYEDPTTGQILSQLLVGTEAEGRKRPRELNTAIKDYWIDRSQHPLIPK